jgi:hypothetical protein
MSPYDRYITTDRKADRDADMDRAIDEYLEKVKYHEAICPKCLKGSLFMWPGGLIDCSHCDETYEISETIIDQLLDVARATAEKRILEEMEEGE